MVQQQQLGGGGGGGGGGAAGGPSARGQGWVGAAEKVCLFVESSTAEDTYFEADHNLRISKNSPYFFNISTNTRS